MEALFGEIVELLGCGALLEEVYHWGKALSVYSLTLFPVHSLHLLCVGEDMMSQLPVPATSFLASQYYGLILWKYRSK